MAHETAWCDHNHSGGGHLRPGPTFAGGMLFVSSGYANLEFMPGNVLLAFSVGGQ